MNNYLLTLVLKADLDEKEKKATLESATKRLLGSDGKVKKEDLWGNKDLAYKIKKQTKGYFAHYEIEADSKNAKGLDKALQVEENIIRYLLVRI